MVKLYIIVKHKSSGSPDQLQHLWQPSDKHPRSGRIYLIPPPHLKLRRYGLQPVIIPNPWLGIDVSETIEKDVLITLPKIRNHVGNRRIVILTLLRTMEDKALDLSFPLPGKHHVT